jgi:hypothetical protein
LKVARARCELPGNAPPVDVFTVQDQPWGGFIPGGGKPLFFEKIVPGGNKITPTAVTSIVEL